MANVYATLSAALNIRDHAVFLEKKKSMQIFRALIPQAHWNENYYNHEEYG